MLTPLAPQFATSALVFTLVVSSACGPSRTREEVEDDLRAASLDGHHVRPEHAEGLYYYEVRLSVSEHLRELEPSSLENWSVEVEGCTSRTGAPPEFETDWNVAALTDEAGVARFWLQEAKSCRFATDRVVENDRLCRWDGEVAADAPGVVELQLGMACS